MKINSFVSGLAGLVLAACGSENNSRNNNNNNNNNSYDGGYSDGGSVNECTLDSECGNDRYCDKTVTPYVCKAKQGNLPPVVIIEAKDDAGNVRDSFPVRTQIFFSLDKSYAPNCSKTNQCGVDGTGIDYCKCSDNQGNSGLCGPGGAFNRGYSNYIGQVQFTAKCYAVSTANLSEENRLFGIGTKNINLE